MHLHGGPTTLPGAVGNSPDAVSNAAVLVAELPIPVENRSLLHREVAVNAFDVPIYAIRRGPGRRRKFEVRWRAADSGAVSPAMAGLICWLVAACRR